MSHPLKKAGISATIGLSVLLVAAVLRQTAPVEAVPDTWRPAPVDDRARSSVLVSDEPIAAAPLAGFSFPEAAPAPADPSPRDAAPAEDRPPIVAGAPATGTRIVVSIDKRWLWYIVGPDTIMSVPVAVGMNRGFEFAGRSFHFSTPRGTRTVLAKEEAPVWTVPEWHYYERARHQDLEIVKLTRDSRVDLSDGTVIVVRGDDVGRVNHYGNFWPFTPGNEIIFDGKVFVPPMGTNQRRVPNALGPYKLDTGNGYLIHGTHIYNENSVGEAVSHGCVRMDNADLERLYWMVERGTKVVIH